ncbi:MAG: NAD-dependent deacetylase [Ignavibacteria bacterium]|nr:MAG: NAD-dependent deacetylase [Ignavibacteria bacterium]KAF0158871.1 MAG: NAD-dependent deacetylase [Ignavibacteria bacterium]
MQFKDQFRKKLSSAKKLVFFTGAGISAESGIATFRGADGIWNKMRPEELASFSAFMKNPNLIWEWYQHRREIIHKVEPNAGHKAIAELEKYYDVIVVTQNVDNLHKRAGSTKIFELHGNIERNFCIACHTFVSEKQFEGNEVPQCEKCGGMIRPDVVWFGENLPQDQFSGGETAAEWSDICFVVGTSAVVYPAAYIPQSAKRAGSYLVEINIEPTELSRFVDYSIIGKAGDVLPKILKLISQK